MNQRLARFAEYAHIVCEPTYHPEGWETEYVAHLCVKRDKVNDLLTARAVQLETALTDKRRRVDLLILLPGVVFWLRPFSMPAATA